MTTELSRDSQSPNETCQVEYPVPKISNVSWQGNRSVEQMFTHIVVAMRDWVGVNEAIKKPANEHPKRLVEGFECQRSEVSGRRLWGLFQERFESADAFFADHFVANYCPLVFMEATGRNRTPDKLPAAEVAALYSLCDAHLRELVDALQPEWVIGVGVFAEGRGKVALKGYDLKVGRILHPSPASPAANRGWGEQATQQLEALGVW